MRRSPKELDSALLAEWSSAANAEADNWDYFACKLITPLYGGGVRESVVDTKMPIRAAGIRGQLRFWWRLVAGPFSSSEEMFQREMAIWGGIASVQPVASQIAVRVDQVRGLNVQAAFVYQDNPKQPGTLKTMPAAAEWTEPYSLFPARGELGRDKRTVEKAPHELALKGLSFRLGIHHGPRLSRAQRQEVAETLRWWATFGGVGARTRRGLGAISVANIDPVTEQEVQAKGGKLVLRPVVNTPEAAWKASLKRLGEFRQGVNIGRNPPSADPNRPGRSRWPEPDAIRRETRQASPDHQPTHPAGNYYPRAAFGLPIVFHFKDEKAGDPPQQLLVPFASDGQSKPDRLASTLILRAYPDGKGGWHPAVLYLPGWENRLETKVRLGDGPALPVWPTDPAERKHLAQKIKPLAGFGEDPLRAFMTYFKQD